MSHSNTYGLTTMNAMLTSQDCICHCLFSLANEMSDNNTYGLTTMNAMLTSQDCICHCLAEMIRGWSPFKVVSVSTVLYPR